ncbi:transmembrane protein 119 [Hypomesus transpacificus]|uniref:transmembrane protein 119 n=1 Tax=Hypomesus transpacificus TaxID=137520 RepID=UPI001F084387|nr:transmembrane protein 119 [Hypomesus transpacificus]XP_046872816.1 transmembrane protein 119 [Hypomesus transpacificus]
MSLVVCLQLACVTLALLSGLGCHASPVLFNMSMDSSGDGAELELLLPVASSTRVPPLVHLSPTTIPSPGAGTGAGGAEVTSLTGTITTTMIRLKDFVLSRVVDFLQENLLIIIVATSLLIVLVFIICCASAMSHKRKLEAYKPPVNPPRKYTDQVKPPSGLQGRPYAVDHVQRFQSQASPTLRTPSKALVGDKEGRDIKPRHQEVKKVRVAEEEEVEEKRRVESRPKEQAKRREEEQQSSAGQPVVCTCHLRKH